MGFDSISERFRSLSTHPGSLYETTKIESDPIFPLYETTKIESDPIFPAGANRLLAAFADQLRHAPGKRVTLMAGIVLSNIATLKLLNRPDRIEPRAKKRRPKPLPLLTVPRAVAREEIQIKRALAGLKLAT